MQPKGSVARGSHQSKEVELAPGVLFFIELPEEAQIAAILQLLEVSTPFRYQSVGKKLFAYANPTAAPQTFVSLAKSPVDVAGNEISTAILAASHAPLYEQFRESTRVSADLVLFDDFGYLSDLYELRVRYLLSSEQQLQQFVDDRLVPWLIRFKVQRVIGARTSLRIQQRVSFAKVLLSIDKLGLKQASWNWP